MDDPRFPKLNHNSPVPLYSQIKDAITDYIEFHDLQPNDPLPSERELSEIFCVSRLTVRKAINQLIQEGVIYQQPGKGTFISTPKIQQKLLVLTSFTDAIRQEGHTPGTQVLDFEVRQAKPSICKQLGFQPGTPLFMVRRLRFIDYSPFSISTSYLPCDLMRSIRVEDLQQYSLYGLLEKHCGLKLSKTKAVLEVCAADYQDAALLNIKPGLPMFLMKGTAWSTSGELIEYFEVLYRGDRLRFSTESS